MDEAEGKQTHDDTTDQRKSRGIYTAIMCTGLWNYMVRQVKFVRFFIVQ